MTQQILILGGTNFIGRNLVERLGQFPQYELTLFNRQETAPLLFPGINRIKGDRGSEDISRLAVKDWDCVIDLSCYYPDHLSSMLDVLAGRYQRYIFISSISAYQLNESLITEETPLLDDESYGGRKAACERILMKNEQADKIIFRPSVVYGKYDHTDRLYYWLYRAKFERPVMIPGDPTHRITLTYVHDLADIIRQAIEIKNHNIVYNVSTHAPLTLTELVHTIDKDIPTINIPAEELIRQGKLPEEHIPLWFNTPLMISNDRLRRDFEPLTPFEKSIHETIAYYRL